MIEIIATVVIAIATGALVFVTRQYAKATERYVETTERYVETTEKALKAADTPEIKVYLSLSSTGSMMYTLDLCIHNIGTGFAYDVKFDGEILSFVPQSNNDPLAEYEIMRNGVNYFAPGKQCRITLFFQYQQSDLPKRTFNITVNYRNSASEELGDNFDLDFNKVESYSQIANPSLDSIALSLKYIYEHFLDMKEERDNQE